MLQKIKKNEKETHVRVLRSVAEIESIRPIWEKMQSHPNADIDFFLTILDLREPILRPHVLLLEREAVPQAMLIGRLERIPLECKFGYMTLMRPVVRSLTIIHGGCVGDLSHPNAAELIDSLYASLQAGEADMVQFSSLPPDSDLFLYGKRRPGLFGRDLPSNVQPHWQLTLPETFEDYLARFKSKRRNDLRRNEKQFEKAFPGQARLRIFKHEDEVDELCRDVEAVARHTYQRGIGAGFIDDPEHRRRLRLAARQGWLRAYLLYAGQSPLAFEIGTLYQDVLYLDFTGFDPAYRQYEPGTLVWMRMIEELCRQGIRRADFGFGDAEYKERYGDVKKLESALAMFAPRFRPAFFNAMRTLALGFSLFAAKAARRARLDQRIKKIWRTLLARKVSS